MSNVVTVGVLENGMVIHAWERIDIAKALDPRYGSEDGFVPAGLIAQDVEKILPEIVSETEDGYKAIAYQSLTAVLIEAMKEQQQQITAQQDQITALEKENQYLKSIMAEQIDALLARVTMLEGVQVAAK